MVKILVLVGILFGFGHALPESIDWRKQGYVTPVINQQSIGSSCAFAAIGAVEGQHANATGVLVSLSVQQVVDCFADNCGGDPCKVFQYIHDVGGVESQKSYPYVNKKQNCMFDKSKIEATVDSYATISPGDEEALKEAVATVGPVVAVINAAGEPFQTYSKGILNDPNCGKTLDHAVLIVGYGTENGDPFWIVKNSWGPEWGEHGYIRMSRNRNNQCGIASDASYPIINKESKLRKKFFVQLN